MFIFMSYFIDVDRRLKLNEADFDRQRRTWEDKKESEVAKLTADIEKLEMVKALAVFEQS